VSDEEFGAVWASTDGATTEHLTVRWDNGGWTAEGNVSGLDIHYAIRLSEDWEARQFLLFRDMEEPDLWLATDRFGRWGEVNGAQRGDLDGCTDVDLNCTPFTNTLPIRRLGLAVGESADIQVAWIDPETLGVIPVLQRYTRLDERRWRYEAPNTSFSVALDTDEHGLVLDYPDNYRRVS
jgi:uncharacterized protein